VGSPGVADDSVFACTERARSVDSYLIEGHRYSPFAQSIPVSAIIFLNEESTLRIGTTFPPTHDDAYNSCEFQLTSTKYVAASIQPNEDWWETKTAAEEHQFENIKLYCEGLRERTQQRRLGYVNSLYFAETDMVIGDGSFLGCERFARANVFSFSAVSIDSKRDVFSIVGGAVFQNGELVGVVE
jgi:hypothetical protein